MSEESEEENLNLSLKKFKKITLWLMYQTQRIKLKEKKMINK